MVTRNKYMFDELKKANDLKASKAQEMRRHEEMKMAFIQTQETILKSFTSLVNYLDKKVTKAEVVNQLRSVGTPDALKVVGAVNRLHETMKTHENTDISPIVEVMNKVLAEAQKIPKELPKQVTPDKPHDYSNQLEAMISAVEAVEEAVKSQETSVQAPVVNVDAPIVKVDAPDLKPLEKASDKLLKAIQGIVIPEYVPTDIAPLLKEQKKTNKILMELPLGGGGGGGGNSSTYQDSLGNPAYPTLTGGAVPVSLNHGHTLRFATISTASSGDSVIASPTSGTVKIKVLSLVLVSSGSVSVKWRSDTTDLSGAMPLVANSGLVLPGTSPGQSHYFQTAAGEDLNINLSGAVQVSGHISYYEEA